jgi:hypothetical protein
VRFIWKQPRDGYAKPHTKDEPHERRKRRKLDSTSEEVVAAELRNFTTTADKDRDELVETTSFNQDESPFNPLSPEGIAHRNIVDRYTVIRSGDNDSFKPRHESSRHAEKDTMPARPRLFVSLPYWKAFVNLDGRDFETLRDCR